jgi:hypothetical protein
VRIKGEVGKEQSIFVNSQAAKIQKKYFQKYWIGFYLIGPSILLCIVLHPRVTKALSNNGILGFQQRQTI